MLAADAMLSLAIAASGSGSGPINYGDIDQEFGTGPGRPRLFRVAEPQEVVRVAPASALGGRQGDYLEVTFSSMRWRNRNAPPLVRTKRLRFVIHDADRAQVRVEGVGAPFLLMLPVAPSIVRGIRAEASMGALKIA